MVFQAAKKTTAKNIARTDFNDLELVKQAEEKSVKQIESAKKRAEKMILAAEQNVVEYEQKAIAELTAKLDQEYKFEEKAAKDGATKIKADGELEAERLKQSVRARMPKAIDYIVNAIIHGK